MGQKISPISNRLSLSKDWQSRWFDKGTKYARKLIEDILIRDFIVNNFGLQFAISRVLIKRGRADMTIDIFTARPGLIIGRQGKGVEDIKIKIEKFVAKRHLDDSQKIRINVVEIKKPDIRATLIAQSIGQQISKRIPYRRAVKSAITKATDAGAKGIKIEIGGRLNGAEIARSESFSTGSIPTSTLKKNIDYSLYHAPTTYGIIGIKVWVYDGKLIEDLIES
ncbi:MAG: small subunit ribosomal protein S3 [Candidatus Berkelbacteria bacterium Licking1014_85]|uniref:Small ribosomal subunit protein uS3 n=1 Tax=Candidatus Berkelbacteria bacterium Licking1014_85 TaxID=2017148 RepID=A0A554LM27_9BACT|nr:MAG: small subunit ribosomal protein S3 [Candidatus Berkelbacteria bacterium Licking1014_85]